MQQAERYPLLSREEEIELGTAVRAWQDHPGGADGAPEAIRTAGLKALNRLMLCNIRLAHYVARRFIGSGVDLADLTSAVLMGMHTGFLRYNPAFGYRVSSFVMWHGMQAAQAAVAVSGHAMKIPVPMSEACRRIKRTRLALRDQNGGIEPTIAQITEQAKLPLKRLNLLRANGAVFTPQSLDAPVAPDTGMLTRVDTVAGDDNPAADLERSDSAERLRAAVQTLDPQHRYIIEQRFLCEKPLDLGRIAVQLNVSRETARRWEARALQILRTQLGSQMKQALAAF